MKKTLEKLLRQYYTESQPYGFCSFISGQEHREGAGGVYSLFKSYAAKWPLALKRDDGRLRGYFIPRSRTNNNEHDAFLAYDLYNDKRGFPLRLELGNFILKTIAREKKKKFVPIEYPVE